MWGENKTSPADPPVPAPSCPTCDVLKDEVAWLREEIHRRRIVEERLREEVLTLSAQTQTRELEQRRLNRERPVIVPTPAPGGAEDPGQPFPAWMNSLIADGHVSLAPTPEEQAEDRRRERDERERELDAIRDQERRRLAGESEVTQED